MKIFAKLFRKDKEKPIEILVDLTFNNMNGQQIEDLCKDINTTLERNVPKHKRDMLLFLKELAQKEVDKRIDTMAEDHYEWQAEIARGK